MKKYLAFYAIILAAIIVNYFMPEIAARLFFIGLLVAYYRSEDEGFWFGVFLILSDGFFGFFGLYESLVQIIPGLPAVEVGQLYVVLSVVKAYNKKPNFSPFFNKGLAVLGIYLIFLIAQGYAIGLSTALNVQFRVVKHILPLLLLYSLPRLIQNIDQVKDLFKYLFPVCYVIVAAQVFTMATGKTPPQYFGVQQEAWFAIELSADKTYRGFYNDALILLTTFGALFFLADKQQRFSGTYLLTILLANFSAIYLSATRGWTISITFILLLSMMFIFQFSLKRLISFVAIATVLLLAATRVPIINNQLNNAMKRMMTVSKLAEGDLSAGGTLLRLNLRVPRVMRKWRESKLTGYGFSDEFFHASDEHVGNHNILLHSGIIGAFLMASFFLFFLAKIFLLHFQIESDNPHKVQLRVFLIFFMGWFVLHSSSEQLFAYYQYTAPGMMLAAFFCVAAITYQFAINSSEKKQKEKWALPNKIKHEQALRVIGGRWTEADYKYKKRLKR